MHGFDYSIPLFVTRVRGIGIVVTSDIVSEVLHVPRVEHPDYPGCDRLKTVSKDELISSSYERSSNQGDRQFTSCMAFSRGPHFLNMVMTFVLHPLSHYNSITEPRARFLLSLLEHLTIDFPFPMFDPFHVMGAIDVATIEHSEVQFRSRRSSTAALPTPSTPSTSAPSTSTGGVTLNAIMVQLQHMDACIDTLTTEMYQVNTRVSCIARWQARLGGFVESPSPRPEASKDDDGSENDDDNEDGDTSSSNTDVMST